MNASSPDSANPRSRNSPVTAKPHWTARFIHYRFVMFLVILGVFGWVMFSNPLKQKVSLKVEQDQQRRLLFNGMKVWRALDEFHKTRGTDTEPYPADLRQLDQLGITEDVAALLAVKPQFAGEWLYFSAADPENPRAPLLISPPLVVKDSREGLKERLVMSVGGAVRMMTEKDAQREIESSVTPAIKVAAPVE